MKTGSSSVILITSLMSKVSVSMASVSLYTVIVYLVICFDACVITRASCYLFVYLGSIVQVLMSMENMERYSYAA